MKALAISILIATWMRPPAWGISYLPQTLEQRACGAEMIVVGKLAEVTTGYMSVTYEKNNPRWKFFYDLGKMQIAEFLKEDGVARSEVTVIFQSQIRPEGPMQYKGRPHEVGESGVWYLRRDVFSGSYIILDPYSPSPQSDIEGIKTIVKNQKCKKKKV